MRGVKEQHLVAHIMIYTSCLDQYSNEPHCTSTGRSDSLSSKAGSSSKAWIYIVIAVVAVFFLLFYFLKRNHCI